MRVYVCACVYVRMYVCLCNYVHVLIKGQYSRVSFYHTGPGDGTQVLQA